MKNKKQNKFLKTLFFLTILLTFFLLWVIFSDKIKESFVKNYVKNNDTKVSFWNKLDIFGSKDLDLKKFWKVYSLIKKNFYSSWVIKKQDLEDWAIAWMVEALWDKHTEFFNTKQTKEFNESLAWDFEGIWAVVEKTPIWVKIDRILKGSPAKKYWLLKWDIITEANWENLVWLSLFDAVSKIKWPAWTKVKLKILRTWEKKVLEKEVVRWKIKIPSVETKTFTWSYSNIWYISLNMFWETSSEEFKKALDKFKDKDWIIIDLRDNWWWYLQSAVEILSNFIEPWKTLVTTKYKNSLKNVVYKSISFKEPYKWKIVILVNWNSASASEITSWALKDYKKAIIVWTKTYWKWSVQEPFILDDGSMVKITIAKWFTPKDKNIDWTWITPDVIVDFKKQDYDFDECKKAWVCPKNMKEKDFKFFDRQLNLAKKVLEYFIKTDSYEKTIEKFKQNKKEEKNK